MGVSLRKYLSHGLGLAVLAAVASGCITPNMVSKRIVTAPNVQNPPSIKYTDSWIDALRFKTNPFSPLNISVGPPDAVLSVSELPAADYHMELVSKIVTRTNGSGSFTLKMIPQKSSGPTPVPERGVIVLLHGYALQKETMIPWAFVLAKAGYRIVLVDVRGHGRSTGETFYAGKYEVADLVQMLNYLQARPGYEGPIGVLGLSLGADLGLLWAARDPRIQTVVALAPYNHPEEALVRFAHAMKMPIGTRTLREGTKIAASKLDLNWSELSGEYAVKHLTQPALFVGAGRDSISTPEDLKTLEGLAPKGSSLLTVPQANHFAIGFCFRELQAPVTNWFQAHLGAPASVKQVRREGDEEPVVRR